MYRLSNPESPETVTWKHYVSTPGNKQSISDNIIYSIEEETNSNTLWIGTRSGLSILDLDSDEDSFVNYLPESQSYQLPYNELDAIIRDPFRHYVAGDDGWWSVFCQHAALSF